MKSKRWGIFIAVVGLLALIAISVVKNQHCKNGERCRGVQDFSKNGARFDHQRKPGAGSVPLSSRSGGAES